MTVKVQIAIPTSRLWKWKIILIQSLHTYNKKTKRSIQCQSSNLPQRMMSSLVSVIVYIAIFFIVLWSEFVLLRGSDEVWHHLGTRTPYRFKYNHDDDRVMYPGCSEQKIWALIRHGSRLPSAKDITGMKTSLGQLLREITAQHKLGKGELSEHQAEQIQYWSTNLIEDEEKFLTREGGDEMILLAERLQNRFPGAIQDIYNNDTFLFRYTATQRAQQSARHFTIGLFDRNNANKVWFPPPKKMDPVLRFYKHCDRWQKQVKKNDTTYKEQKLYGESREMTESLDAISRRLGLDYRISLENASLIYKICGYETAWNKHQSSPWCYAFDASTAEKFEYYYDLKHYWMDGYGYMLTYRQACMPIKDMFEHFSDNEGPYATFLFAHSGTLLKTLSHLSLYKPETPLTADRRQADRQWKTTNIDCFASNLAFVLYKCGSEDYVLTLHQERPVLLPACTSVLCPLSLLRRHFHDSINNCDFADMCSLQPL